MKREIASMVRLKEFETSGRSLLGGCCIHEGTMANTGVQNSNCTSCESDPPIPPPPPSDK